VHIRVLRLLRYLPKSTGYYKVTIWVTVRFKGRFRVSTIFYNNYIVCKMGNRTVRTTTDVVYCMFLTKLTTRWSITHAFNQTHHNSFNLPHLFHGAYHKLSSIISIPC